MHSFSDHVRQGTWLTRERTLRIATILPSWRSAFSAFARSFASWRRSCWEIIDGFGRSWRSFATEECGSTTFDFFLIAAFTATAIVIATEAMGISLPRVLGLNVGR